jgi:hypothetical protein
MTIRDGLFFHIFTLYTNICSVKNKRSHYGGVIMSINLGVENEEDLQLIKDYTLLPILLDMLARDLEDLEIYKGKIIYNHIIFYLKEVEQSIYTELQILRGGMKKRDIKILTTELNMKGVEVEYKVRGYIHRFYMLRGLIKAELMTMLMNLRRKIL